jgi:23S rRNA pseudouridine1911/1915/1917 synthase
MSQNVPALEERLIVVRPEQAGQRLDLVLTAQLGQLTRAHIQHLIAEQWVRLNDAPAKPGQKLRAGDRLAISIPPPAPTALQAEALPLTVVYEDDMLLVIDKPAGLVVHPAPGHPSGTLVNAVLAHAPTVAMNGTVRPGIVHRLDKDTSGLIVVAKSDAARTALVAQFAARTVLKEYLALVVGYPAERLTLAAPIGRDPHQRQRMAVVTTGRPARTEVEVVERFTGYTLVRVRLHTGRTHQIRVHLAACGHPLVGDATYGGPRQVERRLAVGGAVQRRRLNRQFLHASRLGLRRPSDDRWCELASPLPVELAELLGWLRPA